MCISIERGPVSSEWRVGHTNMGELNVDRINLWCVTSRVKSESSSTALPTYSFRRRQRRRRLPARRWE
jgi:hypothetical protein